MSPPPKNSQTAVPSRWVWIGVFLLLTGCGSRLAPAQLRTGSEHVNEIRGERTVGQTFVAQHDGLQAVDILLATFARSNTHAVTFHLRTNPQSDSDLRTVTVSAAEIADNAFYRFSFEPIRDSHHQRYYFFIDSSQSQPGNAITAWIGPPSSYREGSLYLSGRAEEGQLAFKLSYSTAHIILGLILDLLSSAPAALATAALFILPGLALLLWLAPAWEWNKLTTLVLSCGVSAALFPLLLLYSRPLRLRWSGILLWGFLLLCLGLVIWRLQRLAAVGRIRVRWSGWRGLLRCPEPGVWLFWAVVILVFGVRWQVARPISVPMWGDSHQHTYIAKLMIEHGGLFDSWEPYSPYASLTVHFGFHAAVALFHWATGIEALRAVVLVGQIFNGLAVLALYPLAVRLGDYLGSSRQAAGSGIEESKDGRGHWAGVAAVLVAGLLMPMPMEYVNWGRYPQLAGQMILPVALWLFWWMADDLGEGRWKVAVLAGVAAAGMTLTYYRMPYYYATFVLAWLLLYCLIEWRRDKTRWLMLIKRAVLMGLITLVLFLPWGSNLLGGQLATGLAEGVSVAPSLEHIRREYLLWRHIEVYVPVYLCVLSLIAVAWSLARRHWIVTMLGLWTAFLASLVAARLIHLPGASHMQSFAILIALYLPVGLMVGWLIGDLAVAAARGWKTWGTRVAITVMLAAALLGVRKRMTVINPAYALVSRADEAAMEWIRANTPPDATLLVNGFLIYSGRSAVGSDAGWWIPLLGGRDNTMPPQYALLNEAEVVPGYGRAVVQMVADLQRDAPVTPAGLEKLCQFGVTHVYIGQGQGKVALEPLTPYLVPADLAASPYFVLVYHQDRVWIFALKENTCS